jgi:hypothetical protein
MPYIQIKNLAKKPFKTLLANIAMLPLNFHFLKYKISMFNITKSKLYSKLYSKFHGFSCHLTCVNAQHLYVTKVWHVVIEDILYD